MSDYKSNRIGFIKKMIEERRIFIPYHRWIEDLRDWFTYNCKQKKHRVFKSMRVTKYKFVRKLSKKIRIKLMVADELRIFLKELGEERGREQANH